MMQILHFCGIADGRMATTCPLLVARDLSVKYERFYLERTTLPALRGSLEEWFESYNNWRPHEKLGNLTPDAVYQASAATLKTA